MVGGWQIVRGREEALRHAEVETRTLARTLAEHAERTIETVDLSLSTIVDQVQGGRAPGAIADYFRTIGRLEQLHNLAITDETGRWLADTAPPHPEVNSADRPYFLWFTTHEDRALYFAPMVTGRTSGKSGFPISRRINHANGSFAGVAVATFAPEYFADFYKSIRIGNQGTISIWTIDGSMIVRYPGLSDHGPQGPVADASRTFASGPSGVFRSRSPWDGVERLFGFEHVGKYPIVVSVGLSVADALVAWRHEATMEGSVIAGAAAALLILGIAVERRQRRMVVIEAASRHLERSRAEAEARFRHEIEEANRLLLMAEELAQSGHWRLELPANRLTWSDQVYRIHGRDPITFVPTLEAAIAHYHPDDRAEVGRYIGQAVAAGRTFQHGLRIVRADGAVRHVLSRGVCEVEPGGELTAVFGTFMDVTDLRVAEEALATSEARYRSLVEDQSEMISLASLDGTLRFVNHAYARVFDLSPDEMVGRSVFEVVPPAARQAVKADWQRTATARDSVSNQNEIVLPDGTTRWVAWTNRALTDGEGRPTAIHSVGRDIEERVTVERSLRESEARYRLLADNSSDLIALKPAFDGPRTYVSPSSNAVVGYAPDELARLPASDFVHPEDQERVAAEFASLAIDHPKLTSLHRVRHKAGYWIWAETDLRLINAG